MLKAIVPNLDDVPGEYHSLYTQKNGQYEITGIEGIRTQADVDRLNTSLVKERNDHKETKTKFAPFAELDINEVRAKLDRIPELEAAAAGKIDEHKINEMVENRLKSRTAPLEREILKMTGQLKEADKTIDEFKGKERSRTISGEVTAAARKAGLQDTAIEDAVLLAERMFEINDAGLVVVKDNVGATPGIDATTWFTEMQPKRPHWWGPTSGGGAGGGNGGKGFGNNPFAHDTWNMTEQGKLIKENRTRAENMAKAAGTSIGGPRPKAPTK